MLVYNFHMLSQNNTFWVQVFNLFLNSSSFFQLLIFVLMLSLLLSLLPLIKWLTFFRKIPWNVQKVRHQDHLSGNKIKLHSFAFERNQLSKATLLNSVWLWLFPYCFLTRRASLAIPLYSKITIITTHKRLPRWHW